MDIWNSAYNKDKTTKRFAYRKPGIYFIREKSTKLIVYIGMSKVCVYKACYRHFEEWNDYREKRIVYYNRKNYEIRTIICENPEDAVIFEKRLIIFFKPRDNSIRYKTYLEERLNNNINEEVPEPLETVPF